jgi:hypothetical protein
VDRPNILTLTDSLSNLFVFERRERKLQAFMVITVTAWVTNSVSISDPAYLTSKVLVCLVCLSYDDTQILYDYYELAFAITRYLSFCWPRNAEFWQTVWKQIPNCSCACWYVARSLWWFSSIKGSICPRVPCNHQPQPYIIYQFSTDATVWIWILYYF